MRVEGVFDTEESAGRARLRLLDAGIAEEDISTSVPTTADPIAAEYPGQSYENQPGQDSSTLAREQARQNEAVRSGMILLTVEVNAARRVDEIVALMERAGARRTVRA
jgi:hypothetical protein